MIHTDSYSNNLGTVSEVMSCTTCQESIEWNQGRGSRQAFRVLKTKFRREHFICKAKRYVELHELNDCY